MFLDAALWNIFLLWLLTAEFLFQFWYARKALWDGVADNLQRVMRIKNTC